MFELVSWLVASARTGHRHRLGAGIAAHAGDDRHQHGQCDEARNLALEQPDHAGGEDRGAEIHHQPGQPAADGRADRLVDVALGARAGEEQSILARFLLDDVDDVVDGDHADQPPALIDHGGGDQGIFLEAERDLLLVHVDRDQGLLALHHVGDRDPPRRAQDPGEQAGADRAVRRIDHEHFPEIGGEILARAQEIDHVADRPMFGHGDDVAPHQAAGRFLGIGERFLDRGAVVGVERAQHGALLLLLHILDDRDRVVGLELAGDFGDLVRLERVEQLLAHPVVHLGEHVAVEQIRQRRGERAPFVAVDQLEQIGDVGGMERLDQGAHALGVAGLGLVDHLADEFGLQPVVLVMAALDREGARGALFRFGQGDVALAHLASPVRRFVSGRFLGARACPVDMPGLSRAAKEKPMADEQNILVLNLDSGGDVVIRLRPDLAPQHVARIKELAQEGFYDGVVFHRVIPGFMAQGGDPTGSGMGGSDKPNLPAEFSREPHVRGTASMARSQNPDSANSQFFICFDDSGFLDGQYTVWGEVVEGMEHVDALPKGEPPREPGKIVKASLRD